MSRAWYTFKIILELVQKATAFGVQITMLMFSRISEKCFSNTLRVRKLNNSAAAVWPPLMAMHPRCETQLN